MTAWEREQFTDELQKPHDLIQVKGYLYPQRPVRPVPWTGQTGWLDRSDQCQGPVRPVGLQHPLYTISSNGRDDFEIFASTRRNYSDVATRPSGIFRGGSFWKTDETESGAVLRKPPKLHAREDSRLHAMALDAVPASVF